MRANHRDAVGFLQEAYGIAARVEHKGTKHPRLVFTYKGEEHRIPIAGSTSDTYRGSRNMEAQLRSELGPPDAPPPTREPRRLENMMPGPRPAEAPAPAQPDADILLRGSMALYDDGRLRFGLPDKVVAFIAGRAVSVTQPTAYGWKLWPLEDGKPHKLRSTARPRRDGGRYLLYASYSGDILKPFGLESPADYMICDTHVEVDLRVGELQPVKEHRKPVAAASAEEVMPAAPPFNNALEGLLDAVLPEPESPLVAAMTASIAEIGRAPAALIPLSMSARAQRPTTEPDEEAGRALLQAIRDYERARPYDLGKDEVGEWVLTRRAHTIKLED